MRLLTEVKEGRSFSALLFCFGLLQVAAHYLMGATIRSDGGFALPHTDTLLYLQAARRIVEGFPFSFSAGTAVSTGTTSVLYPFVLAIPAFAGVSGEALIRVGFLLNAVFYLVFLFFWGRVILHLFERPWPRLVALALLAFSPQSAFCAFSQSDIGLWMAVSSVLAYGLITDRKAFYLPALLLAPWVRPEGMVCVFAFLVFEFFARRRSALMLSLPLLASVLGVFALNFLLTGHAQFSSVAEKGYLSAYGLCRGLYQSAIDFAKMLRELLLGVPTSAPRDFFLMPVIGAALLWLGLFVHDWRRNGVSRELALLVAALGGFALVATSGWQDTNADRYLAWIYPLLVLFVAEGADFCERRASSEALRFLPAALVMAFSLVMAVASICSFRLATQHMDHARAFAARCEETMTLRSAIGVWGRCGIAYEFSPRRVAHLSGIYSPEFQGGTTADKVERLKHDPSLRFYYCFHCPEDDASWGFRSLETITEQILVGPDGMELRKMKWAPFDAAAAVPPAPRAGYVLADSVDVAYAADERRAAYEPMTDYDLDLVPPFTRFDSLKGTNLVEGGRLLLGGDEMTVDLKPGKDAMVVMRTRSELELVFSDAFDTQRRTVAFSSPQELHLEVDGREVGHVTYPLAAKGFSDVSFAIPGSAITKRPCRVGLHGEHIACAYWFYQAE